MISSRQRLNCPARARGRVTMTPDAARSSHVAPPKLLNSLLGSPLPLHTEHDCVYLDYNGTTPIFPEVAEAMKPYLVEHGNPSSAYVYGRTCKKAVETARQQVAALINCDPSEVFFTSCGTESDNWAIAGAVMAARRKLPAGSLPHVVSCAVEHPAVLACLKYLAAQGLATYTLLPVDGEGLVEPEAVKAAVSPETCLVTIMHSNNEVGTIQPIKEIAAALASLQRPDLLLHTDAAQSIGKVLVDVQSLGVGAATIVGAKFGAPKGVAALYLRRGVSIDNYIHGAGQESGRRAGTENVLLVVGLGAAAELVTRERQELHDHMLLLRDALEHKLLAALPQGRVRVNGPSDAARRLPNTLSISVAGLSSHRLLESLSEKLAASAGAACHSGGSVSSVLTAMALPLEYAVGTLRLSVGRHSTMLDVEQAAEMILAGVKEQGL